MKLKPHLISIHVIWKVKVWNSHFRVYHTYKYTPDNTAGIPTFQLT